MTTSDKPTFSLGRATDLYRFIWRNSSRQQIIACLVALLTLPLTLAPIELQRRMIDDAITNSDLEQLLFLVGIYAIVIILQQGVKFTYNVLRGRMSEHLNRIMRGRIISLAKVGEQEEGSVNDGDTVSMLTGEVEPVGGFGGDAYAQIVTEGGVLLTIFAYMIYTEFWLALVAIAAFVPQAIATPLIQDRINAQSAARVEEIRAVGSNVLDVRKGDERKRDRARARIARIFDIRLLIFKLKFGLKAVLNFLDHSADLVVLGVGGAMVISGETQIGVVVAFLAGLDRLRSPWRTLISYFRVLSDAQLRFAMMREKMDIFTPENAVDPATQPKPE